jgi:hypothetical protein
MLPINLLPETIAQSDGVGPALQLNSSAGKLLVLTLGITRITEQESLEFSVWGSADQEDWGDKPLATIPPKFYCGVYSVLLNLSARPYVKHIRVQWRMKRWSRGESTPMFGFYSFLEESGARLATAAAVA